MPSNTSRPQLAAATLSIGGMTCSSCANDIKQGLEMLSNVRSSNISALTHSGVVIFDDTSSTTIGEIVEVIEDKGYDCTIQGIELLGGEERNATTSHKQGRSVQVLIEGMFCNDCPTRVMSKLRNSFGKAIEITQSMELKNPILSIKYQPDSPGVTIRSILGMLNTVDPSITARPFHPPSTEDKSRSIQHREQKALLWRLSLTAVIAIPTLFIGVIWMSLVPQDNSVRMWFEEPIWAGNASRAQWALMFLATPVYFVSASTFHVKAAREIHYLWRRQSKVPVLRRLYRFGSMNLLISAGTTVAYIASLISLILSASFSGAGNNTTYFDSVVFLTFFILTGRYLEALSKAKAGDAVSMLGKLKPETALLVMPVDGSKFSKVLSPSELHRNKPATTHVTEISADLLEIGDTVVVPLGSSPPADGVLVSSEAYIDESSLTGESRKVAKVTGDSVFLGTINTGNSIKMTITKLGGTSMLDQIITIVKEGQSKRAPVERIADTITGYFVPVITLLAILTFFIWLGLGLSGVLDLTFIKNNSGGWAFFSLEFAIAVFVVACPCGIGLAAPTALYVGSGLAAKAGILVRGGGEAFQEASDLDAVVFDKTGTLTEGGDLKVTDYEMVQNDVCIEETLLWSIVRVLEENSSHPIAKAIVCASDLHPTLPVDVSEIMEIPGQGMKGLLMANTATGSRRYEVVLGSERLIKSLNPTILADNTFIQQTLGSWKMDCKSIAILAVKDIDSNSTWQIATLFGLSDPIRPSAASTVAALNAKGISTYMLSGDNPETARAVALAVGIPAANVFASALPQDKAAKIDQLKQELASRPRRSWYGTSSSSRRQAKIAFVGDGINDAPALLAATVSISLSTGSPIALTSSSFILLTPSLESIITLLSLSKKVFRRIKWNFAWALVYNLVLIPVAAGILFRAKEGGFILGPVWASAAMALSSLSVVMASLAMRWGL